MQDWLKSGAILQQESDTVRIGIKEIPSSQKLGWYFPDFFLQKFTPFHSFQEESIHKIENLALKETDFPPLQWQEPDWEKMEREFTKFQNSDLKKAVLYVTYKAKQCMNGGRLSTLLARALKKQRACPSLAIYGYWNEKEGILGLSPELLCKSYAGKMETVALAATLPIEKMEFLKSNQKLLREQQLVVEGILERWGKEASATQPEVIIADKLAHLCSLVELKAETTLLEAIKKLHPTPAIGTYPFLAEGKKWLRAYAEQFPRKRYGAPCGYLQSENEGTIYVAIRGVEWDQKEIWLTVGSGILKESEFEAEKKELQLKFETVKNVFQL